MAERRVLAVPLGDLEVSAQGLQRLLAFLAFRAAREDLFELEELAQARHRVEVDLYALEATPLTRLPDLRLHRQDSGQHFADRRRIGDGGEQDAALLHAARVRPFVVDELSFLRAVDGTELEPPLAE